MVSPLKFLHRISLASKVWLVIVFVVAGLATLTVVSAMDSRRLQIESRVNALGDEVDTALSVLQRYHDRAAAGEFSDAEARKRAFAEVAALHWNHGKGYLFGFDSNLVMSLHGAKPALVGKHIRDDHDVTGKYWYREMLANDQRDGHGVTEYLFPMPGSKEAFQKISYTAWYKPWDIHLGAGAYFVDIDALFRQTLMRNLLQAGLVGLLVILIVWQSMRSIRLSVGGEPSVALAMAGKIADGDLGRDGAEQSFVPGSLLHALARMRARLVEVVQDVQGGAQQVSAAAQQIAKGNDDLSHRTQEQAASLEETAASMEEMTATVKQSAENATQAEQMVRGALSQASHGLQVAERTSSAMADIESASRQITDIVQLIDEIAFQTNLLALNAAVEAARAGEQGRGFAVVAAEVRQLAQRSATAAREIKGLINDTVEKVQTGSRLVHESGEVLNDIARSVHRVTELGAEITAASSEQSTGIEQVNRAVMQMDEATQQNAALVEEAAAAARAMQEQADRLQSQVRYFRLQAGDVPVVASSRPAPARAASLPPTVAAAATRPLAVAGQWSEF